MSRLWICVLLAVSLSLSSGCTGFDVLMDMRKVEGPVSEIPGVGAAPLELAAGEADWPRWRGAQDDNTSPLTGIRTDWSGGLEKRWAVEFLCAGKESATWGTPVVQGKHLVVAGRDAENDRLFCLNAETGDLIWSVSYVTESEKSFGRGSRGTPSIVDNRVYTLGRSGDLHCWNLADGAEIWVQSLTALGAEAPHWGFAASPLVRDERVYVQAGGDTLACAFDAIDGSLLWTSPLTGKGGYAPLVNMRVAGEETLLLFHAAALSGLRASDGTELWAVPWKTPYGINATTPAVVHDRVVISSGHKSGTALLAHSDGAMKIRWTNAELKATHSDLIVSDGYAYGFSGASHRNDGSLVCLDLESGATKWAKKDFGVGTMLAVDGHLLCQDIEGNLTLVVMTPEACRVVTRFDKALGDPSMPVWTAPIVANGTLYLRHNQHLVAYDLTD